jgi:O-antigen/teichoic acid export membrane protein
MAAVRIALLLAYDSYRGRVGEALERSGVRAGAEIFRSALPLGLVLLLVSLNANLPRYAVEHLLGFRELGVYAAVAAFATVGATAVNALGQSATHRLARHAALGQPKPFGRLTIRLAAGALALGLAGVAGAVAIGPGILAAVYQPEFAAYARLLALVMAAATLGYVGIALGYAVTAARAFRAQVPLFLLVAASCGAASWFLTPKFGLRGAALATAVAASVQIAGEALLLRRALARMAVSR